MTLLIIIVNESQLTNEEAFLSLVKEKLIHSEYANTV